MLDKPRSTWTLAMDSLAWTLAMDSLAWILAMDSLANCARY